MNPNLQEGVAEEVNDRLEKATLELAAKYARGEGGKDVSVDGPSGTAYKEKAAQEMKDRKDRKDRKNQAEQDDQPEPTKNRARDEDDDEEEGEEADVELRRIRDNRLKQIKQDHLTKIDNISKGHGQYREVSQDEFLAEVTNSKQVICHFYHRDFPRCEIMDHHLAKLAQRHIETKFIKVNAEKAPFFIDKLKIRTIPTLTLFFDGVAGDKVLGFEGLTDGLPEGKEDEWSTVSLARLLASKSIINPETIIDEDEIKRETALKLQTLRAAMINASVGDDDDDELFDD